MGTERKRKVSLFDVVDETSVSAKLGRAATTNGSAAAAAANPSINRWTGRPYSARYLEILEKRRTLPVWQQKDDFLAVLRDNQTLILVGETGSGKTTQGQGIANGGEAVLQSWKERGGSQLAHLSPNLVDK
ncbi:hypothetical protein OsI_11294 [Oryza sativa Indica Group]|uniref:RNA helicase n=1 Tax=Oryza sativa subsp. indica TaxID=39946 RepID=B8AMY2_ORYSI|nr:hypothetical protein OsI_11294 [Oryza sativa Indica Group]